MADDWDDLVLDEDFIRSAGTNEPSARARMLAARWRREAPSRSPGAPTSRPRGGSSASAGGVGAAASFERTAGFNRWRPSRRTGTVVVFTTPGETGATHWGGARRCPCTTVRRAPCRAVRGGFRCSYATVEPASRGNCPGGRFEHAMSLSREAAHPEDWPSGKAPVCAGLDQTQPWSGRKVRARSIRASSSRRCPWEWGRTSWPEYVRKAPSGPEQHAISSSNTLNV